MKTTVLAHAGTTPSGGLSAARYLLMLGMATGCVAAQAASPQCTDGSAAGTVGAWSAVAKDAGGNCTRWRTQCSALGGKAQTAVQSLPSASCTATTPMVSPPAGAFMLTAEQQPSCWDVTGWMNPNSWTTQAVLVAASCETVPNTIGWTQVFLGYGGAPSAPLWLRVPLNDWHVTQGWFFQPLLVYGGESGGVPVVKTDILVGPNGDPQGHWLLPYPPAQGVPAGGARARLRHVATNKCLYSDNQNGAPVHNWRCWNDPRMVYVLDNAGSGTYRLRHEMTGQCLYGQPYNGGALSNWICWADSVMRFSLDYDSGSGAYFLRNVDRNQCPYGNAKDGGVVPTWGCWPDPQMLFRVDLL